MMTSIAARRRDARASLTRACDDRDAADDDDADDGDHARDDDDDARGDGVA